MPIRQDSRTGSWFYRFQKNGTRYFEGGYRTKEQAREAEVKHWDKVFENAIHPQTRGQDMTFTQAGEWWLKEYALKEKRSWKNDRARVGLMTGYFGNVLLKDIQPEDIERFLEKLPELRGERIGDNTKNHYLANLKAIYNRLKKKKLYYGDNPACYVEMKKVPHGRVRFLYPAEEKMLSPIVAQDAVVWPFYLVGLHTGMRISEIMAIRVENIDFIMEQIFVPNSKSYKSRYVPMSGQLVEFLRTLVAGKKPQDLVMPHWSYGYIFKQFKACCAKAGISNLRIHDWRHTFVQRMLGKGVPIYKVSKMVGHSDSKTTEQHYGHLCAADLTAEISKIDGVVTWQPSGNRGIKDSENGLIKQPVDGIGIAV